jgi:hypothetical protein
LKPIGSWLHYARHWHIAAEINQPETEYGEDWVWGSPAYQPAPLATPLAAIAESRRGPPSSRQSGRLVHRHQHDCTSHPFAPIPNAVEMASNHDVHLRRWWDRAATRSEENTSQFLRELFLEWVIYRHLRVATRKLANQGVSTFKYRPEEGHLLLVAERLPGPTYTAPRVRQGFRVTEDLHCIRRTSNGAELSEIGEALLEAHHV